MFLNHCLSNKRNVLSERKECKLRAKMWFQTGTCKIRGNIIIYITAKKKEKKEKSKARNYRV